MRNLLPAILAFTLFFVLGSVEVGFAGESPVHSDKVSPPWGYDHLALRAQRVGSVRIIVKVNVAVRPTGELSQAEAASQRGMIALAQEAVLEKLSDYNVSNSYKY
ncbi:secreted protein, partial [Candidatus Magnetobacterium bavaricum]